MLPAQSMIGQMRSLAWGSELRSGCGREILEISVTHNVELPLHSGTSEVATGIK